MTGGVGNQYSIPKGGFVGEEKCVVIDAELGQVADPWWADSGPKLAKMIQPMVQPASAHHGSAIQPHPATPVSLRGSFVPRPLSFFCVGVGKESGLGTRLAGLIRGPWISVPGLAWFRFNRFPAALKSSLKSVKFDSKGLGNLCLLSFLNVFPVSGLNFSLVQLVSVYSPRTGDSF